MGVRPFPYTREMLTLQQPFSTDCVSHVSYRRRGPRLGFVFSNGAAFQLFSVARLTPLRPPAAPPRLIDNLPSWVETPCHRLLSRRKSIKNNTHLHPWAQSPFVFSLLPVAGAIPSKCRQTARKNKYEGKGGGGRKQIWRELPLFQHLLGRVECTDGKA